MADFIKREDIENAIKSCTRIDGRPLDDYDTMMIYEINDLIDCIPSADVAERKRGKWLEVFYGIVCDVCGGAIADDAYKRHFMPDGRPNFCPFCGADMRPNEAVNTEVLNEQIQC